MSDLYYTAPTDEQFNELKEKAIRVWQNYDDTYGYASEKINRIKDITNVRDNFMYVVAMFDIQNQTLLAHALTPETKEAVNLRMIAGGQPALYNPFMPPIDRLRAVLEMPDELKEMYEEDFIKYTQEGGE
jgi:hypothetical protein